MLLAIGSIPGSKAAEYSRLIVSAEEHPTISDKDRTRLAEAFRLADQLGDQIWPGWSKAPFAVLLVTQDQEFLIRHPKPSDDFTKIGYDTKLKSDVYYRKRTMSPNLLATFPAIRGSMVSTIVVGQAETTSVKTSTPWVIILLHEHFHQLQDSQPNFYAEVNALNLAGSDQTGMWMLNYPFPYDRVDVQQQFVEMSKALNYAAQSSRRDRAKKAKAFLESRQKFQQLVSRDDYKYLAFQFWKEGIARYTEYHLAHLAASRYRPSAEFRALPDYRSFADVAQSTYDGIFRQLQTQKLGVSGREVVYSFGGAEGLLLDKLKPGWRKKYFVKKFDLGQL